MHIFNGDEKIERLEYDFFCANQIKVSIFFRYNINNNFKPTKGGKRREQNLPLSTIIIIVSTKWVFTTRSFLILRYEC